MSVSREDIEKYCLSNGLNPNKDSSNEDTKYKRNLIRKEILPLMKEINPNVIDAINSLSQIAKEDENGENSQKYFVRQLLIDNNLYYDRKRIEELSNFIEKNKTSKSGKTISLSKDLWFFVSEKEVKVINKLPKSDLEIAIKKEGEYAFGGKLFIIRKYPPHPNPLPQGEGVFANTLSNFQINNLTYNSLPSCPPDLRYSYFPHDSEFKAYISVDKIDFTLRYRQDGDFIRPLGLNGKQKLKKYLNEKKIPKHEKDKIILLCKGQEVLWVSGFGISNKIKVENKPTHIIELR